MKIIPRDGQLGPALVATLEKVLLAFVPRVVIAAMHTTTISANITAYSTAVGPSSLLQEVGELAEQFAHGGWPCGWESASVGGDGVEKKRGPGHPSLRWWVSGASARRRLP